MRFHDGELMRRVRGKPLKQEPTRLDTEVGYGRWGVPVRPRNRKAKRSGPQRKRTCRLATDRQITGNHRGRRQQRRERNCRLRRQGKL